jgi:hypothetical protein
MHQKMGISGVEVSVQQDRQMTYGHGLDFLDPIFSSANVAL